MQRFSYRLLISIALLISPEFVSAQSLADEWLEKISKLEGEKNYDSAVSLLEKVAVWQREAGLHEACLETITRTGRLLVKMKKYDRALKVLQENVPRWDSGVDSTGLEAEAYYDALSDVYYRKGDALASLRYHKIVYDINLHHLSPDAEKRKELNRIMGVLHLNTARYIKSIEYFQQYLSLTKSADGEFSLPVANAYNYLGIAYRHLGEVDLARTYYEKAVSLCERYTREERTAVSPSFTYIAPLYNNLGNIYCDEGQYAEALRYFQMAVDDVPADAGSVPGMNVWYRNKGEAYDELGNFGQALIEKRRAGELIVRDFGPDHVMFAKNILTIGDTYLRMKAYEKAREQFLTGLRLTLDVRTGLHPQTAYCYQRLANAERGLGNYRKALTYCQQAFAVLVPGFDTTVFNNPPASIGGNHRGTLLDIITTKSGLLFDHYKNTGDNRWLLAAGEGNKRAIEWSRVRRLEITDKASKTLLAKNLEVLYEQALESTLELYRQTGAFAHAAFALEVMEENKSGRLIEAIQSARSHRTLSLPDSLTDLESGIRKEIARCEQGILDEQVREDKPDSTQLRTFEEQLFTARHSLAGLVNYYRLEFPQYFLSKYNDAAVSLKDLQDNLLQQGDLFVEFYTTDTSIYLLSASRNSHHFERISGNVYQDLRATLTLLQQRETKSYQVIASRVYRQLIPPMLSGGMETERFIIVPDGLLSSFPFEALPLSEQEGAPFLLEKYAVNYRYSAALMKNGQSRPAQANGEVLAMAPGFSEGSLATREGQGGLPYAQEEVEAIMTLFPGLRYTGSEATENKFREIANGYHVLHLATHALIDTLNPDRSFLFFAGEDSLADGRLFSYELFNMELTASMVTLSACNTAVGRWDEGEGAMSLARAFAYAGCPSMVTSLWPAQDRTTAKVMTYFYENLAEGMRKDEALRQAKLSFLKEADKVTRHPYFWAGFIQIGDDLPLISNRTPYYWIAVLLVLAIPASVFYYRHYARTPAVRS